jgi:hypothetical protein
MLPGNPETQASTSKAERIKAGVKVSCVAPSPATRPFDNAKMRLA